MCKNSRRICRGFSGIFPLLLSSDKRFGSIFLVHICFDCGYFIEHSHPKSSVSFVNLPSIIVSLAAVKDPQDATEREPSFAGIPVYVRFFSVIKGILHGQYYLSNGGVSKIIEYLGARFKLGWFNHNQIRGILQGFQKYN